MRLWHIDLIPVLPKAQLIAQWRECVAIVNKIDKVGSPKHGLVNKVLWFEPHHLYAYTKRIFVECIQRGIKVKESLMQEITAKIYRNEDKFMRVFIDFTLWHNERYLRQCYYNLQEKYDCGLIKEREWREIDDLIKLKINIDD